MAFTQNLQEKQIQIKYLFLKQVVTSLIQFVDLQKYFANIHALVLYSVTVSKCIILGITYKM